MTVEEKKENRGVRPGSLTTKRNNHNSTNDLQGSPPSRGKGQEDRPSEENTGGDDRSSIGEAEGEGGREGRRED